MTWFRRSLAEGETSPPWYFGRAYRQCDTGHLVMFPIPLNWIIGVAVVFWFALRRGPRLGRRHWFCRESYQAAERRSQQTSCPDPAAHRQSTAEHFSGPMSAFGCRPIFRFRRYSATGEPTEPINPTVDWSRAEQAEQAARARLRTLLTTEQYAEYDQHGWFTDQGAIFTGSHLRADRPDSMHRHAIIVDGVPHCLQIAGSDRRFATRPMANLWLPPTDHVIHRLLAWRRDPAWVLRTAQPMDRPVPLAMGRRPALPVDEFERYMRETIQNLTSVPLSTPTERSPQ